MTVTQREQDRFTLIHWNGLLSADEQATPLQKTQQTAFHRVQLGMRQGGRTNVMLHSTHEDCVAEDGNGGIHIHFIEKGKIALKRDHELIHFDVLLLQTR